MDNLSLSIEAKRLSEVSSWLNSLFPNLNLPVEPCDEELRTCLFDGYVLCAILNKLNLKFGLESQNEKELVRGKSSENVKRFLSGAEAMGLPSFKELDLKQGSMSAVVNCLLSLRACMESTDMSILPNSPSKRLYLSRKRWKFLEADKMDSSDSPNGSSLHSAESSPPIGDGKRRNMSDLKFQSVLRNSTTSDSPSAMLHHAGYKFHEVFQLKQGRYSDLSAAKISEMVKSNGLDNAPTQSLLSVVNGILDESIDRKNDEIPQRVSCLLRKVVQEIERRISTQAEHIRNQNNLIKAREEKYQSRIRALETLATGTNEESRMVTTQLQTIKTEKIKLEEKKKQEEEDRFRLSKDKENSDLMVAGLKLEMEKKGRSHEEHCTMLEAKARETQAAMEGRIKEFELLLQQSRQRNRELEEDSQSKYKSWNSKEESFKKFMDSQMCSLRGLKISSNSIRDEVMGVQKACLEDLNRMGSVIKGLAETAENYHAVLDENRKLFNEVQELKGNIRVYCRIKPFLPGQKEKLTVVDYIGENGEIMVVNPSKQGKDGSRMFKFNKVFGPSATQEDVFKDTRPLIRSVLDGYNVCIFAYGQTGSGKTYTMTGPDLMTKKEWGVNYRALDDLFQISKNRKSTINYEVAVQMVEIYNEQVRDLLTSNGAPKRLGIWTSTQPNGLAVPDASMHDVKSTTDVLDLMQLGFANRAVGATALNVRSSRSHSILSVHVRGLDMESGASLRGTLHLVDLAGSERVDRSEAVGDRLKEAQHINKSLSALGDVIFALSQKSPHVPYRNSKLTQVLQTSLGGQAKTLMFVQINPEAESFSESVSTLKFAERVSGVELGAARSSKEGKDVRELMEQVASLKDMIARKDEEIGQLRDLRAEKPTSIPTSTSLKHSSSASQLGISARSDHRKFLPGRNQRASSDGDIASVDSGDVDRGSCGDSEERGSDISDGYASGNTEVTTVTDIAEKTTKGLRQQSLRGGAIPRTGSVKTSSTGMRRGAVVSQPSVSLGRSSKGWK